MTLVGWITLVFSGMAIGLVGYHLYPLLEQYASKHTQTYLDWVVSTSERMFHPLEKRIVLIAMGCLAGLGGMIGFWITRGYGWITLLFTCLLAYLGWSAVRLWISFRWQIRLAKFDTQLIDGLTLLANSLKSGLNLSQAVQVLVQEMPDPLAQEFGLVLSHEKIGLTLDGALERMLERIPSEDLSVVIHSILILRETGGDLSETFDVIASTIRERRKVDGKIKALTAQGKIQGLLLFVLPFAILFLLYLTNPAYIRPLFTTELGWMLIVIMLLLQVIGGLWILKIVRINI